MADTKKVELTDDEMDQINGGVKVNYVSTDFSNKANPKGNLPSRSMGVNNASNNASSVISASSYRTAAKPE